MKAILISDHAKWCALMMNGDKNIEVRKGTALYKATQKLIDEYGFAEFYVYCTKNETLEYIYDCSDNFGDYISHKGKCWGDEPLNGKVLFKFRCYKVEEIIEDKAIGVPYFTTQSLLERDLCKKSCLTPYDFNDYLKGNNGSAIHISDLEIFDKPKELSEFKRTLYCDCKLRCENNLEPSFCREVCSHNLDSERLSVCCDRDGWVKGYNTGSPYLTKAPQSFMFIEVE